VKIIEGLRGKKTDILRIANWYWYGSHKIGL